MEMDINNRKGKAGRRIKAASAAILLMGLLIGCTNTDKDAEVTKRAEPPKNELTNFKTEDGKIDIVMQNKGEFSTDTLKQIKEEILGFYAALQKEKISLSPPSRIYLNLHNEQKVSSHNGGTINLYYISEGNDPLIHEMTHALFNDEKGQVTQEGLAIFMQETYSERSVNPNYKEDTHEIMKDLISKDIILPLETLLLDSSPIQTWIKTHPPSDGWLTSNPLRLQGILSMNMEWENSWKFMVNRTLQQRSRPSMENHWSS
ncbi:hypothetical protein [Bacillus sp. MMSF_3328]|uniref:hypothetical protein n=1 Tax=Bacillus sp. MMSF_3328 TaxID=3047080 RepID=UPI00273F18FA|nr:hypothetical protein [Bacillus sp. MMSF_3328]